MFNRYDPENNEWVESERRYQEELRRAYREDSWAESDGYRRSSYNSRRHGAPGFWRRNRNALFLGVGGALVFGVPGAVVGTFYGVYSDKKRNYNSY
ncbi:hypothetical protein NDN08_005447 [Rhodosorus marinus]|uniref:Uncharacterized protein n=1 Tax=Rhodosorus marinus TaxID=101924 RepID=A0AAV8V4S4_9RHOD|nr:hypothetical protein NDN08_005447 [Rhodosorus marinus]